MAGGAVMFLSACVTEADYEMMNSSSYQMGYHDGCTSAHTRVPGFDETIKRDNELFESDKGYRRGWSSGYGSCSQPERSITDHRDNLIDRRR
jgi:hypothetical protein